MGFFLTHYCLPVILERVVVANNQVIALKTKYVLSCMLWEFFVSLTWTTTKIE